MGGCAQDSEPVQAPAALPVLTATPASVALSGTVGRPVPDAVVHVDASPGSPDLAWCAATDAVWLTPLPAAGVLRSGSGELSLSLSADGLGPGVHKAKVTLTLGGIDGVAAIVPVTVEMQSPEDPEVVAARTFWQSELYHSYWGSRAPGDVRAALLAYTFPEYGLGKVDEVHVKAIDFGYVPELYVRPVARARCEVSFTVWESLTGAAWEEEVRRYTRHWGEVDVILQVDPGPYSTNCNGWSVVDLQNRALTSTSTSVSRSDSTGAGSDCGCDD